MLIFNSIKAHVLEHFPTCLKLQKKLKFLHNVEQYVANCFMVMRRNGSSEILYLARRRGFKQEREWMARLWRNADPACWREA